MRAAKPNGWSAVVLSRGQDFSNQKKKLSTVPSRCRCPAHVFRPHLQTIKVLSEASAFLEYSFSGLPVLLSYPPPKTSRDQNLEESVHALRAFINCSFYCFFRPPARELGAKGKMAFGWKAFRCRVCRYALGSLTCSTQRKPPTPQDHKHAEAFLEAHGTVLSTPSQDLSEA